MERRGVLRVGARSAQLEVRPPPRSVTMFVYNDCRRDVRVLKEAASLRDAGYVVNLVGLAPAPSTGYRRETREGFPILLVPRPQRARRQIDLARRPWRHRHRLKRWVKRGLLAPPGGWARVPVAAVGVGLASPWLLYRALDHYVLGDRAPSPGRKGAADWLFNWRYDIAGWGRAAAALAPRAEIWHGHDLMGLSAAVAARREHGGSVVYDSHELFLDSGHNATRPTWARRTLAFAEQRWMLESDALITVSLSILEELRRRYALGPAAVVRNCPPRFKASMADRTRLRRTLDLPADARIAIYHGAFVANRGMEELAAALLAPGLTDVHGVFMGFGPERERVVALAADPRYSGRIHLLDPVGPFEILEWVSGADVGVVLTQPSSLNNVLSSPNKLYETLAAGVPVVASDFPEFRVAVGTRRETGLGVLCEPTDPRSVAEALRWVLSLDAPETRRLRERCLEAGRTRWNWETEAAKLLDVYATVEQARQLREGTLTRA